MKDKRGCFKTGCFGCLGLVAIGVLVIGISALVAWRGLDDKQIQEAELAPRASVTGGTDVVTGRGRVILELSQGGFEIRPARAGEGVSVEARYDSEMHELTDRFETLPDSTWVYHVVFRRTMPALQAMFRAIMGGGTDTYMYVYLPPDIPIALEIIAKEGGLEADIGGLWITEADVDFARGGFSLVVDEPLREPMDSFSIRGRMGGFEAERLGNASPRTLDVDCKMGGADIDLRGLWVRDCDVRLAIGMGGMGVTVPDEVEIRGIEKSRYGLRPRDPEVPVPILSFSVSESMGEIEVIQR